MMLEGGGGAGRGLGGGPLVRPGDCVAWPKGSTNGHHLRNESERHCIFVVVERRRQERRRHSDIDMVFTPEGAYARKDGSLYGGTKRSA